MTSYVGPATVVLEDGTELPVTAQLHATALPGVRGLPPWRGAVGSGDNKVLYRTLVAHRPRLRLPNGRESAFVASPTDALGGRVVSLDGDGPAPF